MKKHIFTLLLAFLLLTPTMISCSSGGKETETDKTAADTTETTTETETETERPYAKLPEKDYGGEDTPIFVAYNVEGANTVSGTSKNEFGATELTGEAVNDARYERNATIEDRFNVKIVSYDYNEETKSYCVHEQVLKPIDNLIMAGDNHYAFMLLPGYTTCKMALSGTLLDLKTIPEIDFAAPWWDQKANADLTVLNRLYYTTGDISTADNDATCTILFNKVLADNYAIESPYDLVKSGKWTLDTFLSLCETAASDVNGDGEWTRDDQYGALIWDDSCMAVVNASGEKCAKVDESGKIVLSLNTEKVVNTLDKFVPFGRNKSIAFQYQRAVDASDLVAVEMFSNNQALFFMQLMQIVPKLRDMEADFGIVPYPKYDEAQTEYYNTVGSWHSVFFCIPQGPADLEKSGIMAEALACEGMYTVTPAYYDVTLKTKSARDEESAAMLDLIFETRVYDLGWYYQFGDYNEGVMDIFRLNKKEQAFTSLYEKKLKKAEKKIGEVNEAFAAIDTAE